MEAKIVEEQGDTYRLVETCISGYCLSFTDPEEARRYLEERGCRYRRSREVVLPWGHAVIHYYDCSTA